ncbi:MAG: hypothetical protein HWN80_03600 [Candidatus Lokiarchaeota archaeon]|nr:hypothetical protein [Candidatus Lokiarchaeota archaeon]
MINDKKKLVLQALNLITFIITVIINYAAATIPLGLGNTGYISDLYPNLFVPAGITFSIWGVIYVFLGMFCIYQIRDLFKQNKVEMPYLNRISFLFILSNLANTSWILFWHYGLIYLSIIAMLVILVSLIGIYLKLEIGKTQVNKREKWFVQIPFSIYLGWITVATIANVTAVLVSAGVEHEGVLAEILTITVISVAVLITIAILYLRKDYAYSLVVLWAVLGIFLQQFGSNITIGTTAVIALVIITAVMLYTVIKARK